MSTEANKAIVVQLYEEVFNKGDLDLADKLVAPNAVNHDPASLGQPRRFRRTATTGGHPCFGTLRAGRQYLMASPSVFQYMKQEAKESHQWQRQKQKTRQSFAGPMRRCSTRATSPLQTS